MRILAFILFCFPLIGYAQVTLYPSVIAPRITYIPYPFDTKTQFAIPQEPLILMPVKDAYHLEYWGSKGIASKDLIPSLYKEINLQTDRLDLQKRIIDNCQSAKEEYRNMVAVAAARNQNTEKDLAVQRALAEQWKVKAKKRGEILWSLGGAAAAALAGIIFIP